MGLDETRIAVFETRLDGHDHMLTDVREAIGSLGNRMDGRFISIDRRFDAMDRRFEAIDRRFEAIDRRFEAIDRRFDAVDLRFVGLDQRFDALDSKVSRQFVWLVGIQVTSLIAIVGALGGVIAALLSR